MEYFITRQPVFDKRMRRFGYELFFMLDTDDLSDQEIQGDKRSSKLLSEGILIKGMEILTGGGKTFIPISRSLLLGDITTLFQKEQIVVEILDDVLIDTKIISACIRLKKLGYMLALGDLISFPKFNSLCDVLDIVSVDYEHTAESFRREIVKGMHSKGIKCLVKNVESREAFNEVFELGFDYFQGSFFYKPSLITGRDIPGFKLNILRILKEFHRRVPDFNKVEKIIKQDVSLSYKLLRLVNSAAFGFKTEIKSIKQALVILGVLEAKKWIVLIAMSNLGKDKPEELLTTALVRAKFCELSAIAINLSNVASECFLLGLFSLVDAFLDQPLKIVVDDLPLSMDIKIALKGKPNVYRSLLELCLCYEGRDWKNLSRIAKELNLSDSNIPRIYRESVTFTNQVFESKFYA